MSNSKIKLNVVKVKSFPRNNGRTGQTIVVLSDNNRNVEVSAVDKEEFDFSSVPTGLVEFDFAPQFNFQKSLSKNDKTFYLNYLSVVLNSCNDIEVK